jgi:hypothetical protein
MNLRIPLNAGKFLSSWALAVAKKGLISMKLVRLPFHYIEEYCLKCVLRWLNFLYFFDSTMGASHSEMSATQSVYTMAAPTPIGSRAA